MLGGMFRGDAKHGEEDDMVERKRSRGCGCCGIIVLVLLVGVAWLLAVRWGVLEKVGLQEPIAERVFAPPPDREATGALMGALQAAGMNTRGVGFHVLPMADGGSTAILTLDASQGFDPERLFGGDLEWDALEQLSEDDTFAELGVTRLAFDYRDENGKSIVTLTAPTEALRQLAEEEITEQEFVRSVMGRIDIPALTGGVLR